MVHGRVVLMLLIPELVYKADGMHGGAAAPLPFPQSLGKPIFWADFCGKSGTFVEWYRPFLG